MWSFTAPRIRCLHPRYLSVVWTETCPRRNWICSSSPPEAWQSFAQERLRSCGATCDKPTAFAYCFTTCQTTRSETPLPQTLPARQTHLNNRPAEMLAEETHRSIAVFTHSGTGTVFHDGVLMEREPYLFKIYQHGSGPVTTAIRSFRYRKLSEASLSGETPISAHK
jgi:hypothetical protein